MIFPVELREYALGTVGVFFTIEIFIRKLLVLILVEFLFHKPIEVRQLHVVHANHIYQHIKLVSHQNRLLFVHICFRSDVRNVRLAGSDPP